MRRERKKQIQEGRERDRPPPRPCHAQITTQISNVHNGSLPMSHPPRQSLCYPMGLTRKRVRRRDIWPKSAIWIPIMVGFDWFYLDLGILYA